MVNFSVVDYFSLVVFVYVFNQLHGHRLLSDALHSIISMSLKLRGKSQVLCSFKSLMDDASIISDEMSLLASNIKREVINVLDYFLSILKVYDKKKNP